MKCPYCGVVDSQVRESRAFEDGLRRRRECHKCGKRFTTHERVSKITPWVVKKDGRREPFDKEKIIGGMLRAIRKRPVSVTLVEDTAEEIERLIIKKRVSEVPSTFIGREVLKKLKKIDRVAWLRFASVYLEFENLNDFERAIDRS